MKDETAQSGNVQSESRPSLMHRRDFLMLGSAAAVGVVAATSLSADVMRVAALVHSVAGPDYERWPSAEEILKAATIDGARSAMLDAETGSLEVGKKADLLILKTTGIAWTPLNDIAKHLVYCENGSSIETVIVNGAVVARDGRLTTLDEDAVLAEVREVVPAYLAEHARIEDRNRVFEPWFAEIHRRATLQDIGLNRYQGDAPLWPGGNKPFAG